MKNSSFRIKLAKLLLNHYLQHNVYPQIFILGKKEEGDLLESFKDPKTFIILDSKKEYFHYILENIPILIVDVEEFMVAATFDNITYDNIKK